MRLRYPIIALLSVATVASAPADTAPTLAADTADRWVPFDLTRGNQIRFRVTIDGAPATAILDTGVSASVVSEVFASAAGLTVRPRGRADAIGGDVAIGWTPTQRIAFGGLTRSGGGIGVTHLPTSATGDDGAVDMLVGHDLIDRHAIDIDYGRMRFRLLPSGLVPFRGTSVPIAVTPDRRLYVTEIALGERRLRPIVVDTGDGSTVTLSRAAWQAAKSPAGAITTTIAYGLGGPQQSELTVVPALAIGALQAREVEVRIEPRGGFSQMIGAAGRIGSGFLQHFRVLIDPTAGHMMFATTDPADLSPLKSTSGILARREDDRLRVLHVMRGSPAEADGWQRGDTICTVDGGTIGADYEGGGTAMWTVIGALSA